MTIDRQQIEDLLLQEQSDAYAARAHEAKAKDGSGAMHYWGGNAVAHEEAVRRLKKLLSDQK